MRTEEVRAKVNERDSVGFFRRELPGGAVLVGERVPGRRSLAVGIRLAAGSRDERPGEEGAAHFVEHLVFKGTRRRSAPEIASCLERVGGSLDAFTTKETTCFYSRVLEGDVELAVDVLADLVSRPCFAPADVERERKVVLEELRSLDDNPEDLIGDLAMTYLWPGHIMGVSILGTEASLAGLDSKRIGAFHRRLYRGGRIVVSAVGAVDPDRLAASFARAMDLPVGGDSLTRRPPKPAGPEIVLHRRDASQLHLNLVVPAPAEPDPRRYAVQLLAEMMGGGMSSRLFQAIREQAGLAYSVYSYSEHFSDCGIYGSGLAVSPARVAEALEKAYAEMRRFIREGPRPGELDAAKAQARGALIMGEESLTTRMLVLARMESLRHRYEPPEVRLARYDAVSEEDVLDAARELLDPDRQAILALGPVEPEALGGASPVRVIEDGS